ncbi:MAG: ABC-2 family transporter protein [Actinomycetota bacterium]
MDGTGPADLGAVPVWRVLAATSRSAWREALANRAGFWSQIAIMIVNDVVWVVFWFLFFDRVGSVRGWDLDRLIILFAILTTSAGIVLGLLNNARRTGQLAATGALDAALALPVSPLTYLLVRRVEPVNVGDLFFGIGLFLAFGDPTPARTVVFAYGVGCAVLILTGFLVLVGSLSFWAGRSDAGDLGFHALLLFSNYPVDIFGGATRVFLYAVVPAGFVSSAPARLVDDFDVRWAIGTGAVALVTAAAGATAFSVGLRRYTSGATWTRA